MCEFSLTDKNTTLRYCLIFVVAGGSGCTAVSGTPEGCQIVDLKNDAPTPFAIIKPQSFGDLVKLAREYPERKLLWCEDGYFAPLVD
jgi:hypothetical protein